MPPDNTGPHPSLPVGSTKPFTARPLNTPAVPATATPQQATSAWKQIVAAYRQPDGLRASWQLVNSVGGYVLLWYLMYLGLSVSWWITIPLAVLTGGLFVRVFIIFHDCGHGSFFRSRRANDFLGAVTGLMTFTPYAHWRWEHSVHHQTVGRLDQRGVGDIWTLTVQEYLEASRTKRFAYRLARNPVVLFLIAPLFLFVCMQRVSSSKAEPRVRRSVWWTNLGLAAMAVGLSAIFGIVPYLLIQLTILAVAGSVGVWLFYVQHQFEDAYWEREDWDFTAAALRGSSFYKLPRVLQWFSGNIGFHHIHHLSPRIPNYNLERCHDSDPVFRSVKALTLFSSLRLVSLRLWDEQAKKLVGFRHLALIRKRERNRRAA